MIHKGLVDYSIRFLSNSKIKIKRVSIYCVYQVVEFKSIEIFEFAKYSTSKINSSDCDKQCGIDP